MNLPHDTELEGLIIGSVLMKKKLSPFEKGIAVTEFFSLLNQQIWCSIQKPAKMFSLSNISLGKIHPTQKPVALYKWLLTNYAKAGDTILDTHLGSGSSRIAAYDLGFDFTGYELDKDYFDAQEKRFADHIAQARLFDVSVLETVEQSPLF